MKFGIALGRLNPAFFVEVAVEADHLGFESVWLPEHLVLPMDMTSSPFPGEDHPPVPPTTPVFDCFAYLSYLAGRTERIKENLPNVNVLGPATFLGVQVSGYSFGVAYVNAPFDDEMGQVVREGDLGEPAAHPREQVLHGESGPTRCATTAVPRGPQCHGGL